VAQELWEVILHKIDRPMAADTPMDEFEDYDAEDEYDPVEFAKAEDSRLAARICAGSRELAQEETEADQLAARGDTLTVDFDRRQPSMDHRKRAGAY
jgi:hypothetical protein